LGNLGRSRLSPKYPFALRRLEFSRRVPRVLEKEAAKSAQKKKRGGKLRGIETRWEFVRRTPRRDVKGRPGKGGWIKGGGDELGEVSLINLFDWPHRRAIKDSRSDCLKKQPDSKKEYKMKDWRERDVRRKGKPIGE